MSKSDFWEEYLKAVESGETRKEFAARMGTTTNAVYSRVYDKRKLGYDLPHLPPGPHASTRRSEFAELMEKHGIVRQDKPLDATSKTSKRKKSKPKPKVEKAPKPVEESHGEPKQDGGLDDRILDILGDLEEVDSATA